jgi:hypothetical protein
MYLTTQQIESGLEHIRQSPASDGTLRMIVRRPQPNAREVVHAAELDPVVGLVGDSWKDRRSKRTPDGSPHPDMQLNIINARTIHLLAGDESRWPLAGDQLFVDLDLSGDNLPPGTRLAVGSAVIEVTAQPHTGCEKFIERFGRDAMLFVNSAVGRSLNMRGINAKVVSGGAIHVGSAIRKISTAPAAAALDRGGRS